MMKMQWFTRVVIFGLSLCWLMASPSSQPVNAAGIYVDTAEDVVSTNGKCSLREAINNANSDIDTTGGDCTAGSGIDLITFDMDYTITLNGSQLPSITSTINITGNGPSKSIIQAHSLADTANWRVFNVEPSGNLTLNSLTIQHGKVGGSGGGIYNDAGALTINGCSIVDNIGNGGGIYNDSGTATITNSFISNNSAGTILNAGGIYNSYGTLTISGSTFYNNSGYNGGGIFNFGSGSVIVTNSTFSENDAVNMGGGIMNFSDGTLDIIHSTFSGNSVDVSGGGIYNNTSGKLKYSNTIIANSTGGDCVNSGTISTNTGNLVEDDSCTPDYNGNPLLEPLSDNGGTTLTHALNGDSHAIDFGNVSACTATDQRGASRPQGSDCDIGAYEVDFTSPEVAEFIVPSPSFILNIPITSFAGSDNNNLIAGFLVTISTSVPAANDPGWTDTPPPYFSVTTDGTYTLYPWVKDTDGNVSAVFGSPRIVVVDTSAMPSDVIIVNTDADNTISGDEFCTLSEAINNANSDSDMSGGDCGAGSGEDTITFAGHYVTKMSSRGFPLITSAIKIIGYGTENTIIQPDSSITDGETFRVDSAGNLRLENLTIKDFKNAYRGAIFNDQGEVSIFNSDLIGNESSWYGGAITNIDGVVTITNSSISENEGNEGGGIYNGNHGSFIITNTLITNNFTYDTTGDDGGGIYNLGDLIILNSTISGNSTSGWGGGIFTENGTLSINNSTLTDNSSLYGGGIYSYDTNTSISGCNFEQNSADAGGGIIVNQYEVDRTFVIIGSSFINNFATDLGGGIQINLGAQISVINSTFSTNITGGNGGGIFNNGVLYLTNNTLSGNIAYTEGGGILNYDNGTLYFANNIISNSVGYDCINNRSIESNLTNFIEDGTCDADFYGDPNLGPLADNGGPTFTHALLENSPAIDSGDIDSCPLTDQRGVIRPQRSGCDIGAFELEYLGIFLPLILR